MKARVLCLVVFFPVIGAATVLAQGLADQLREHQPFRNLQIIDPAIDAEEMAATMQEISRAIGSEQGCLFCHVGVSGQPLAGWDFESDAKVNKEVARVMLRMVESMNAEFLSELPGRDTGVRVTCRTCHATRPRPIPLEVLLLEVVEDEGVSAAVERYRSLRGRYFAADAYDFNEYVLRRLAAAIDPSDPEARIAVLDLNLEFYPDSWRSFLALGEAYLVLSEPELAEIAFQRSLTIRPSNAGLSGLRRARGSAPR